MSQYEDNGQFTPPNYTLSSRESYENMLRNMLNSEDPMERRWVQNEEIIERFLHVAYDDFDVNEEMMIEFECQEVVDYLLTFLDREGTRSFIKLIIQLRPTVPILVLAMYSFQFPKRHLPEIVNNVCEIYARNQMENHEYVARLASRLFLPDPRDRP